VYVRASQYRHVKATLNQRLLIFALTSFSKQNTKSTNVATHHQMAPQPPSSEAAKPGGKNEPDAAEVTVQEKLTAEEEAVSR
jgi:hypothetical protein